jgi:inward rectifier potassium channel
MAHQQFDPGISQKIEGGLRRVINRDGSFNVHRKGIRLKDLNFYQVLINLSWPRFLAIILGGYVLMNSVFACCYLFLGIENLQGADASSGTQAFLTAFFFSCQTFTTVGYGTIAPKGTLANLFAGFEAMAGLMSFAIATGLLYGRFSRPSARISYSSSAIMSPYQGKTALMFRIVNARTNLLLELQATVLLMTVERRHGHHAQTRYHELKLERSSIYFFPLNWTVVHPIDESSPLHAKTLKDLEAVHAEIIIQIKGFDDTFSQVVHSRFSYRANEIVWGAKFLPMFDVDQNGDVVIEVDRVGEIERVPLE